MQRSPLKEDFFQITKINRIQEIGKARNLEGVEERDIKWFKQRSNMPAYSHVNKGKLPSKHKTNSIYRQFEQYKQSK